MGDADPSRIESWYYALWAYNGWALENHPAGPDVDPFRAPELFAATAGAPATPTRSWCSAASRILPRSMDRPLWEAVDVALPDLGALAAQGGPLDPAHFYEGWNRLRSSGFVVDVGASAFAEMNMPLPAASRIHEGSGPRRRGGGGSCASASSAPRCSSSMSRSWSSLPPDGPQSAASLVVANSGQRAAPLARRRRAIVAGVRRLGRRRGRSRRHAVATPGAELPSVLRVRASAGGVPEGEHVGELRLEASLADGSTTERTVTVYLNKLGAASYRAGTPQS